MISRRLKTEVKHFEQFTGLTNSASVDNLKHFSGLNRSKRLVNPARFDQFPDADQTIANATPKVPLFESRFPEKPDELRSSPVQIPGRVEMTTQLPENPVESNRVGPRVGSMFSGKHEIGSGNGRLSGESKLPDCVIAVSYTNVECPAIDQAGIGF
jgi:hypothetical protein